MSKVQKPQLYNYPILHQEPPDDGSIVEAHYTKNIKVAKPKVSHADIPLILPNKPVFSDAESDMKLRQINNDIFQHLKKERREHDSLKTFVIGLIGAGFLGAGIIAFLRHLRGK